MRLIDIDKHFEINEAFYRADIKMPLHRVKTALEYAPTVEAIAVEWLTKKADEYIELGLNTVAKELNVIIAEWRKENAKND